MSERESIGRAGKVIWTAVCIAVLAVLAIIGYLMVDHPKANPARGSAGSLQQGAPNAERATP